MLRMAGYAEPSHTFAKRVTTCPFCRREIHPDDFILNPGLEPPAGDKQFWWGHAECPNAINNPNTRH